jgi:hypothetical protein
MAVHAEKGPKARPLFTGGKEKKKEERMSLWSDQGMRYFKKTQQKWTAVYVNEVNKQEVYAEFKHWLNIYGKNIKVGKRVNKTLHSVLARWISTVDSNKHKREGLGHNKNDNKEGEEDEENEEEVYNSDIGHDLPSKRWSREERETQDKHDKNNNKGTYYGGIEIEQDKDRISVEMNERGGGRNWAGGGEQGVGSPAKGMRSQTARDYN